MLINPHPFITSSEIDFVRAYGYINEKQYAFAPEILDLIHEKQWLRTTIPKEYDGLEWDLPSIIQLFETLAYVDGSLGWAVNLGAGANLFSGFLDTTVAKDIFSQSNVCCAGSGAITGKAYRADGGYILTGFWKYASGAAHATHFTANAYLYDDIKKPIFDAEGNHQFCSFIVPREAVVLHDSWETFGLMASSSHNYEIDLHFVSTPHTFSLSEPSSVLKKPLYQFPFMLLSVVGIAVMSSGITLHFIELFKSQILTKKPLYLNHTLGSDPKIAERLTYYTTPFLEHRTAMFALLDEAWQELNKTGSVSPEIQKKLTNTSIQMSDAAFTLVSNLYRYCGMSVVFNRSEINKTFRDLYVASQHFLISPLATPMK